MTKTAKTLEEVKSEYGITPEEFNNIYKNMIWPTFTAGTQPVEMPVYVVVAGQPGSGKTTSLFSYSTKMFPDGNEVELNSDAIKKFYPKEPEVAENYPDYYTLVTDQGSNGWTSNLFEDTRRMGYNGIFEGTMKNHRVADESIKEMRYLGVTVVVRVMATGYLESRLSILERYVAEKEAKGYGRLVVSGHHDVAYAGCIDTADYIEKGGIFDVLEIYTRGADAQTPQCVYSVVNEKTQNRTLAALSDKQNVTKNTNQNGFKSAKDAIEHYRAQSEEECSKTAASRLEKLRAKAKEFPEILSQVEELEKYCQEKGYITQPASE